MAEASNNVLSDAVIAFCADSCRILLDEYGLRTVLPYLLSFLRKYYPLTRIFCGFRHYDDAAFIPVADTLPGGADIVHYLSWRSLTPAQVSIMLQDDSRPFMFQGDPLPDTPHGIMRHEDFTSHVRVPLFKLGGATFQFGFCSDQAGAFSESDASRFQLLLQPMGNALKKMFAAGQNASGIAGQQADGLALLRMCGGLVELMQDLERAASSECTILIGGETGAGKDLVADAIHQLSPRKRGPFIKINCGAVSDSLQESEFFGHEKGSFTGALSSRAGYFEAANGGTLFLDEVGELSPRLQAELLRVLDNREIMRVGSSRTIPLDVRIVAATNRDLSYMVEREEFREDLWYRLNVFPLHVPPLRQRRTDIPLLARLFADRIGARLGLASPPAISEGEMARLCGHDWPGNVRELKNVVERAVISAQNGTACMPLQFNLGNDNPVKRKTQPKDFLRSPLQEHTPTLEEMGDLYTAWMIEHTGGKISGKGGAAEKLGAHPNTVRQRIRRLHSKQSKEHS